MSDKFNNSANKSSTESMSTNTNKSPNVNCVDIDSLFAKARGEKTFQVPKTWTQGRTVYGGLSAALLLCAIEKQVSSDKTLRALNVAFSAPTLPEMNFTLETELLREGKTVAQWQGRLIQNGVCCVQVQAVFALALDSSLNIQPFVAPEFPAPEKAIHYPGEGAPGFTQYYQMAQAKGDLPVSGGSSLELGGWMRFRNPPENMQAAHLVSLIDVWPPAVMMHMRELKAGSTVNWTLQFPQPMPTIKAEDYVGYQASIEYAQAGFAITHAQVWNTQKQLLALSQQTIVVYS